MSPLCDSYVCLVSGFFLTFLCYIWYCVKLKLCVCSRNHVCVVVSHVCVIGVLCCMYRILTQSFVAYRVVCCIWCRLLHMVSCVEYRACCGVLSCVDVLMIVLAIILIGKLVCSLLHCITRIHAHTLCRCLCLCLCISLYLSLTCTFSCSLSFPHFLPFSVLLFFRPPLKTFFCIACPFSFILSSPPASL